MPEQQTCDHEFWCGSCLICEAPDPDYDPTPQGYEITCICTNLPDGRGCQ